MHVDALLPLYGRTIAAVALLAHEERERARPAGVPASSGTSTTLLASVSSDWATLGPAFSTLPERLAAIWTALVSLTAEAGAAGATQSPASAASATPSTTALGGMAVSAIGGSAPAPALVVPSAPVCAWKLIAFAAALPDTLAAHRVPNSADVAAAWQAVLVPILVTALPPSRLSARGGPWSGSLGPQPPRSTSVDPASSATAVSVCGMCRHAASQVVDPVGERLTWWCAVWPCVRVGGVVSVSVRPSVRVGGSAEAIVSLLALGRPWPTSNMSAQTMTHIARSVGETLRLTASVSVAVRAPARPGAPGLGGGGGARRRSLAAANTSCAERWSRCPTCPRALHCSASRTVGGRLRTRSLSRAGGRPGNAARTGSHAVDQPWYGAVGVPCRGAGSRLALADERGRGAVFFR